MDTPSLRDARPQDRDEIEALLEESGLSALGLFDTPCAMVVAERDGLLLGMAGLERHGDDVLLRSVAVRDSHRSLGIGHMLVSVLLDYARDLGMSHVYLLTETAVRFFAGLGFERVSRSAVPAAVLATPLVTTVCDQSCTCMTLALCGPSGLPDRVT